MKKIDNIFNLLIFNAISNYKTDDIYLLFNSDLYSGYLKENDIKKLKEYIVKSYKSIKNVISKSLNKMLSNCFKKDLKNVYNNLENVDEISGIIRMSKYEGKGKIIYVVHEIHGGINNKCNSNNAIAYYDLYKSIFNNSNKFIDLYIEGLFSDTDIFAKIYIKNLFNYIKNYNDIFYIDLLRSYMLFYCDNNMRCHWIDIRLRLKSLKDFKFKTNNKSDKFAALTPLYILLDEEIYKKNKNYENINMYYNKIFGNNLLSLNSVKDKLKDLILYNPIDDYIKFLFDKQIKKINKNILISLNDSIILLIDEAFDKHSPICYSFSLDMEGRNSIYLKEYILDILLNITLEYFVLLRLFKNYKNEIDEKTKKVGSNNSINALIHMGSLHSTRIEFVLQKMNFNLLETTFNTDNRFCVDVKNTSSKILSDDILKLKNRFDMLNKYNINAKQLNIKLFDNNKLSNDLINILNDKK